MGLNKLKLAVFISGRGSNMLALMEACKRPDFPAEIVLVLSNRPDAKGLVSAKEAGIATEIVDHKGFSSRETFEAEVQKRLQAYTIDYIVLAGFMRVLTAGFVDQWLGRMVNIHPSLLPDYKGTDTHARVLADGKRETGCTVHYVVPDIDSGEIIVQKRVPVLEGDTPDSLAARVLEQEHVAYPEAIERLAATHKNA
ncbi:MAG: phosphoribosylglycinamide formyltransferase [Alphaproteobacteria bacterium]|nr:phosphoribosylglycinamide formyltransferase [Alphaproteobacteria bacterium]